MTRETKTERIAREAAELAAYQEQFVADYPDRLLIYLHILLSLQICE